MGEDKETGRLHDERGEQKISIIKDGPYIVSGEMPLAIQTIQPDENGYSYEWEEGRGLECGDGTALCRCGKASDKPYCDGTHTQVSFDGTETAVQEPYVAQARLFAGPGVDLQDAQALCAGARFCDREGGAWQLTRRSDDPQARELVVDEAGNCPSGRLVAVEKATGSDIEPELEASIGVVQDPAAGCSGPLWLRGGIPVESADGAPYETRNRATLCRCGQSRNKPFCDSSHVAAAFRDGIT